MQLEKDTSKQEEPINFYDELFAKKSSDESIVVEKEPENKPTIEEKKIEQLEDKISKTPTLDKISQLAIVEELKKFSKKIKLKYLVPGLLMGVILNISVSHYQAMDLQHTSQKFATGLMYNLSETNNLEQIAQNIYLGMKDNGWEPKVKLSNSNIFVFELDNGGQFTITKSQDINSTKFHVEISEFSNTMIKALMIQLEPANIGGTKNLITNKKYDSEHNTVSFDLEKLGQGIVLPPLPLPTFESPLNLPPSIQSTLPGYPPLSKNALDLPPVISVPISPELQGVLNQDNKNTEDNGILKKIK